MMIGVVGKLYSITSGHNPIDHNSGLVCGNGKTTTVSHYCRTAKEDDPDRWVITNFKTDYSEYMDAQEMFDGFFDREHVTYGFQEIQKYLNSLGNSKVKVWVEGATTQRRKLDAEIYWDAQRWMSVDNRIREYTDIVLIPKKYHVDDGTPCQVDPNCQRLHYIKVFSDKPMIVDPILILDCSEEGKHYNTNEICEDVIEA